MYTKWNSIVAKFGYKRSNSTELRLSEAYQNVFRSGRSSAEDREIVLADLMSRSGFARITSPDESDRTLRHREGARHLMALILGRIDLDSSSMEDLRLAARKESIADQQAA